MIGKKGIYLERNSMGRLRGERALKYGLASFHGLGNLISQ